MRRFTPKFHGGPEVKLSPSRRKRGLKQSDKLNHGPVVTVVMAGRVLLEKRFRRAISDAAVQDLSPQPSVSASATSQQLPGRGGIPAKTEPPTRNNRAGEAVSHLW